MTLGSGNQRPLSQPLAGGQLHRPVTGLGRTVSADSVTRLPQAMGVIALCLEFLFLRLGRKSTKSEALHARRPKELVWLRLTGRPTAARNPGAATKRFQPPAPGRRKPVATTTRVSPGGDSEKVSFPPKAPFLRFCHQAGGGHSCLEGVADRSLTSAQRGSLGLTVPAVLSPALTRCVAQRGSGDLKDAAYLSSSGLEPGSVI